MTILQFVKPTASEPSSSVDRVKAKYNVRLTILKEYAKYLQRIELKRERDVREIVMNIADKLNEKHSLGNEFFRELDDHVSDIFMIKPVEIRKKLEGDDDVIDEIMNELKTEVSPGFKPVCTWIG